MKKFLPLFSVLIFAFVASAQTTLNWKGYDTCDLIKFKADTFRVTKTFINTNAENKLLVLVYDDTNNAARATDSLSAEIGYQLGAPVITLTGLLDSVWSNCIPIDSVNSKATNKRYSPLRYNSAGVWPLDTTGQWSFKPRGQIDTTIGSSSSAIVMPFIPHWSPFIRFYIKGLTGNAGTFIRGKFIFEQRGWINVREQ